MAVVITKYRRHLTSDKCQESFNLRRDLEKARIHGLVSALQSSRAAKKNIFTQKDKTLIRKIFESYYYGIDGNHRLCMKRENCL